MKIKTYVEDLRTKSIAELNVNYYSVWFIKENGCDKYYQYKKGLLFDEQQAEIMAEMDELERKF